MNKFIKKQAKSTRRKNHRTSFMDVTEDPDRWKEAVSLCEEAQYCRWDSPETINWLHFK